jgi:RimJ/RimL family protein N-acetyltransferase
MQPLLDISVGWALPSPLPGVTVRPMRPADVGRIHAMHNRLSLESVYYRYLRYRPPALDEIAALYRVEPETRAGFVATVQQGDEQVVGVAYAVREQQSQPATAEAGILVEDRFQGQGVGHALWQRLLQHARTQQMEQIRLFVHPGNWRMQRLLRKSGMPYVTAAYDELTEYLVTLEAHTAPTLTWRWPQSPQTTAE